MCIDILKQGLRIHVCLPVWQAEHKNSEWVASNLELLIGLALPHVTEQVPAGLSNASCCSQHRLSGLCENDITTFITLGWPGLTQASINHLKQISGSEIITESPSVIHLHWDTDQIKKTCSSVLYVACGYQDYSVKDEGRVSTIISRSLTSAAAGSTDLSRSDTAPASILAAPMSLCPLPTSSSINAASSLTPLDISVRLEEMVVIAQPTAV